MNICKKIGHSVEVKRSGASFEGLRGALQSLLRLQDADVRNKIKKLQISLFFVLSGAPAAVLRGSGEHRLRKLYVLI